MPTKLLPPFTAVRLAWAITGKFSKDETTKSTALIAEDALKRIQTQAAQDVAEQQYVSEAVATIEATLRSLDVIYKGRELNFEENQKLRDAYMETMKENIDFGTKAQDFMKSLPTMAITGAGTAIPFGNYLADLLNVPDGQMGAFIWALGLAMAGAGHLIHTGVVRAMRKRTQTLYVKQDYERNLYYDQYVGRVAVTLTSLYFDLDRVHQTVFGVPYPVATGDGTKIVEDTLRGVRPTMCKYVHAHMADGTITPSLWAVCESGGVPATQCRYWKG